MLLRLEAVLALIVASVMIHLVPLNRAHRALGHLKKPRDRGRTPPPDRLAQGRRIAQRVTRVARRLPWRSTCLVRATAATLLLQRRGIAGSVIRLGVRKSGDWLEAHAWLTLDDVALMGHEEAERFIPLADIRRDTGA